MAGFVEYDPQATASPAAPSAGFVEYQPSEAAPPAATGNQRPVTTKELFRQLGLAARIPVHAATGTLGVVSDALTGLYNEAANLYDRQRTPSMSELVTGKQPGFRFQSVTPALNKLMTQLGLPEPETPLERGVQVGGQMLAGGMDPALRAVQLATPAAPAAFTQAQQTAKANTLKELRKAGYKFLPSQAEGGVLSRTTEGLSGAPRIAGALELKNQQVTQNLTAKALGLPPGTTITDDVLSQHAKQLIESGYDPIKQIAQVNIGAGYRNELRKIADDLGASNRDFPAAKRGQIEALVNKYLYTTGDPSGRFIQKYSGSGAINEVKLLRQEASQNFKPGGDALLGEAQRRVATALENNIERSLPQGSELISAFREARKGLAKNYAVERMLVDKSSGIIDPRKAHSMQMSGTPLTDELATIAKAGSPLYSKTTKAPIGGLPAPISVPESMFMGGAGASIPLTGGLGATAAAVPMARATGRAILQTNPVQNALVRNAQKGGSMFGIPEEIAQRLQLGSLPPLFSMGEQ